MPEEAPLFLKMTLVTDVLRRNGEASSSITSIRTLDGLERGKKFTDFEAKAFTHARLREKLSTVHAQRRCLGENQRYAPLNPPKY